MKRLFFSTVFIISSLIIWGADYYVKEVVELINDISARTHLRTDENDQACAFIKFNIPTVDKITFDNAVGDVGMLPGEYILYIKENTPILSYTLNGEKNHIAFSDYEISIEGKKTYRVLMKNANSFPGASTSASITANQDGIVVLIDGEPIGETPVYLDAIEPGSHIVSVPYQKGYSMEDITVDIIPDKKNEITLSLVETTLEPVEIEIASTGGDTAGDYERWGISRIENNGKHGIIDYTGTTIIPCEFDWVDLEELMNGYYSVWIHQNSQTATNYEGRGRETRLNGIYAPGKGLVVPCDFEWVKTPYKDEKIIEVKKNGKWGIMDENGKLLSPIKYEKVSCNDGVASMLVGDYCYDLYDYQNDRLISNAAKKHEFFPFNEGYSLYEDHYRAYPNRDCKVQGIIDRNGNEVDLPYGYEIFEKWHGTATVNGGLFPVKDIKTKKIGFMNPKMQLVIPAFFDEVDESLNFRKGVALVRIGDVSYIIDPKGVALLDNKREEFRDMQFKEYGDYIKIEGDKGAALYDLNGNPVIPVGKYRYIYCIEDGSDVVYYCIKDSGESEIFDKRMNYLFSLPEDISIRNYSNGMFYYEADLNSEGLYSGELTPYGYLNIDGEIIAKGLHSTETYYDALISDARLSEGLGIINIGDLYGYVDNKGKFVIPMKYTAITPFENGRCFARDKDGKWVKINRHDI